MTAMVSLSLLACGSNNAGESETIPNVTEVETTSTLFLLPHRLSFTDDKKYNDTENNQAAGQHLRYTDTRKEIKAVGAQPLHKKPYRSVLDHIKRKKIAFSPEMRAAYQHGGE